jgi:hypothetical protein
MFTANTVLLASLLVPLSAAAGGGGDYYPPQEQRAIKHVERGPDWTTIIVSVCGMVGAVVPAYFGYKRYQKNKKGGK